MTGEWDDSDYDSNQVGVRDGSSKTGTYVRKIRGERDEALAEVKMLEADAAVKSLALWNANAEIEMLRGVISEIRSLSASKSADNWHRYGVDLILTRANLDDAGGRDG